MLFYLFEPQMSLGLDIAADVAHTPAASAAAPANPEVKSRQKMCRDEARQHPPDSLKDSLVKLKPFSNSLSAE
jgi:hypothetical protein